MANKAIPFEVLQAKQTARKDRHGSSGADDPRPKVSAKQPKCPRRLLGTEGQRLWTYLMRTHGIVIKEAHAPLLTMTCALYEDFVASRLDRSVQFTAAQYTQLRLCLVELGISPSALSKLRSE